MYKIAKRFYFKLKEFVLNAERHIFDILVVFYVWVESRGACGLTLVEGTSDSKVKIQIRHYLPGYSPGNGVGIKLR